MQLRPDLQIPSLVKAMTEVVIPALDSSNALAMQQAQLVVGHLVLMMTRLPLQYRADRDELDRLVGFAAQIQKAAGRSDADLSKAAKQGAAVLERARAEPGELVETAKALTAALDVVIRGAFKKGDKKVQSAVQEVTLAMSKDQLLRNRAWLIMQGWEPDPASVPAIETLLPARD